MDYDDGVKPDSFDRFTHRWITPASIMVLFGAVVWGVQLNLITLQSVERIAALSEQSIDLSRKVAALEAHRYEISALLASTAATLDKITDRIERCEGFIFGNNKNSQPKGTP